MVITVMNSRYQTSNDTLSVIRRPSTPVKPARNTARCRLISALVCGDREVDFDRSVVVRFVAELDAVLRRSKKSTLGLIRYALAIILEEAVPF